MANGRRSVSCRLFHMHACFLAHTTSRWHTSERVRLWLDVAPMINQVETFRATSTACPSVEMGMAKPSCLWQMWVCKMFLVE